MDVLIKLGLAGAGAFAAAFWVALVLWSYRDVQSRTQDAVVQVMATLLVASFNLPGLLLYIMLRPSETLQEAYNRSLEEETLLREIEELTACPTCHRKIEPGFQLCPVCKTGLKQPCPSCEQLLNLHWDVCPYCATQVAFERPPRLKVTEATS